MTIIVSNEQAILSLARAPGGSDKFSAGEFFDWYDDHIRELPIGGQGDATAWAAYETYCTEWEAGQRELKS